ncbi:CapA family protein [Geothrix limicola]|nr:CapA family protein [Geothrix limicola]
MDGTARNHRNLRLAVALLALAASPCGAQAPAGAMKDDPRSVYQRRIHPPEPPERIDWPGRIGELLKEEPGDLVVTAVGDLIFNQPITQLAEPERAGLFRLMQEADVAYANMEFSLNDRPDLQRPFYNFRAPRDFRWELARTGINLVSQANNHAMDFGPEGLKECLQALDQANITHAGAGATLAEAHAPGRTELAGHRTTVSLLSYMRYWTAKYRSKDPSAPSLATIDPAVILAMRDGKVEKVEGPLESDVAAMEEDILLARRKTDLLLVSLHNHDVTHHRAHGIQDTTPPNEEIMFRRAIEAGADLVIGTGPHVLRGIEIHKGRPIFYSLGDFIYQYRTPDRIPADILHQRDIEMPKVPNGSVWDRRDSREVMETVMVRMILNQGKLKRIQLLPVTIDDEGPLYGVPRLASTRRSGEIIALMQKLSAPYGTRILNKGWYAEVDLERSGNSLGKEEGSPR